MKMLKLSAIFSFYYIAITFSVALANSAKQPLFLEEISPADIGQAKAISSFVTQIRRSNLDSWSIRQLKGLKNADLLPNLSSIVSVAEKISKTKSGQSFFETCSDTSGPQTLKPANNIERIITHELNAVCKVRFIENLLSEKRFKALSSEEKNYFKNNIRFYLLKDRRHLLKRFLKMLERDSQTHEFVSNIVTDAYIKFDIIAEKDLVALLNIGKDLTGHIQSSGLKGLAGNVLFEREFRNLIALGYSDSSIQKRRESVQHAISFQQQNSNFIRQRVAWLNFIMLGKELGHLEEWSLAKDVLEHAHRIAKGADQIDESLFQTLFLKILKKNPKDLFAFIDDQKLLKNYDNLSSKLQFWIAYSLESNGKKEVSSRLFERLLSNNPLSFYTIIAQREYQLINDKPFVPKLEALPVVKKEELSTSFKHTLKRLRLWLKVNDRFLAERELERIKSVAMKYALNSPEDAKFSKMDFKRFTMLHTTDLLNHEKAYLTSFKVLYNAFEDGSMPVNVASLEFLFPAPYLQQIQTIDHEIDPLLILSLIRQESAFNPEARSHVGARGLMQLMPATARELKRGVRTTQLVDPDLNLKLGIKYFKRLLKKYDGNLIHTLAAYNAGEGNLKRWMKSRLLHDDPLVIIESIPYKETRKYVKLIYRNIFFYKYLAGDTSFVKLPIADSFNAKAIATASRLPAEEKTAE